MGGELYLSLKTKWGKIRGTLSNQTDLQAALNAKQNALGFTPENVANKATDFSTVNHTLYPSIQAVNDRLTAYIAALDAVLFKGVIDCSANPNYPAADAGFLYRVSVAGKIGGASGPNVQVGDTLLCLTDATASGNHATVGANWNISQVNIDGAVIGPVSSSDNNFPQWDGTSGNLLKGGKAAASAPTADTLVLRDANGNIQANNLQGAEVHATANGTTVLTAASPRIQIFTGSNNQTVQMPVVSTVPIGHSFIIVYNGGGGTITCKSSGGNFLDGSPTNDVITGGQTARLWSVATSGTGSDTWKIAKYFEAYQIANIANGVAAITDIVTALTASLGFGIGWGTLSSPVFNDQVGCVTSEAKDCHWLRQGDVVIMSGQVTVVFDFATLFGITYLDLPFTDEFGTPFSDEFQAFGTISGIESHNGFGLSGKVNSVSGSTAIKLDFVAPTGGGAGLRYTAAFTAQWRIAR